MSLNVLSVITVALLLATACAGERPMELDELLARHAEARGGAAAIEAVHSIHATLQIEEPTFRVRGEYVATRAGHMRIDIHDDTGAVVFTEAIGPDGGWQLRQPGTDAEDLSPEGEKALQRGLVSNLYGLHELSALGYHLYAHGTVTQDGENFRVVEVVAPDDHVQYLYLGARSFLVERELEKAALHPDIDPTVTSQLILHDDFREAAGVLFAHRARTVDRDEDRIIQSTVITRLRVNEPYDEARFRRPL